MFNIGEIYIPRQCKSKRISSYDKTGGNKDRIAIAAGEIKTIAEIEGCGVIRHIWMTISSRDPMIRRNAILRMYWDDEKEPSVESPIGDFFGQGWGEQYNYASLPLAATPASGSGLCCYFPMPFKENARITVENQSEIEMRGLYYYIDYELHERESNPVLHFHALWNRELTTPFDGIEEEHNSDGQEYKNITGKDNYIFADILGKGHFVGINYFVDSPTTRWPGEGDDLFLIDGELWPGSLHGTGAEDFFNTAWCPNEIYAHPYFGCAKVPHKYGWLGRTHYYRFFLQDPIYFEKSLVASIEHGHANTLTLDLATVAYWYQSEPHKKFALLPPVEQRQNMPEISPGDIHEWRKAWRELRGNRALWGNEK